jgi:hypothetical protein
MENWDVKGGEELAGLEGPEIDGTVKGSTGEKNTIR